MPQARKTKIEKESTTKKNSLSVSAYSFSAEKESQLDLPADLFGAKINKPLLAQAVRVYLAHQKGHFGNTKTRGEVVGSTKKIFRQKGTGRARHGAIRAPIFVGGGIALGPKFRKVTLSLPEKMKRAALLSALSYKLSEGAVKGLADVDKISGKTADLAKFLKKIDSKNALIITTKDQTALAKAAKNLPNVDVLSADQVNTLTVVQHEVVLFTKEAVEKLESRIKGEIKQEVKA